MADRPLDPRVEAALAGLEPDDLAEPPAPPSEVWDAIEAAVRAEADADPSAGAAATLSPDSQPATRDAAGRPTSWWGWWRRRCSWWWRSRRS